MNRIKVSSAMEKRFPIYYQGLIRLQKRGITRIRSSELSSIFGVESSSIRRDFSSLGELGKQGYGYNVDHLIKIIGDKLGITKTSAILVGAGSLGKAFLKYDFKDEFDLEIVNAYDIDDSIVGTEINGIKINKFDNNCNYVDNATIAIVTVNSDYVAEVIEKLIKCRIKGILNFTSERFMSTDGTYIHNVDLSAELLNVVYSVQKANKGGKK